MYICTDVVCDPDCDFCWFCIHDENGAPVSCKKGHSDAFNGVAYCAAFRCSMHEEETLPSLQLDIEYIARISESSGRVLSVEEKAELSKSIEAGTWQKTLMQLKQ